MDKKTFFIGTLLIAGAVILSQTYDFVVRREADALLPEGRGKTEFISRCSSCHHIDKVIYSQKQFDNWDSVILWMQKMQGMSPIPQKDRELIIKYLELNFPMKK